MCTSVSHSSSQLQVGEGAIALQDEMCCHGPGSRLGLLPRPRLKVRHRVDASVSFGCEAHRVNELVVRLRIVQL